VLDQGDTGSARATVDPVQFPLGIVYDADCGPIASFWRPIVDLSRYWRVREYSITTGDTVTTFTDTTFASVNGIAVDSQGRVYVSGVLMFCSVDPFDSRNHTLEYEYRVYRYEKGGSDPDMPGASWHRDRSYEVGQGTGIGSTLDPRHMYWDAFDGPALYFADTGNNDVQKYSDPSGSAVSYKIDVGEFNLPLQAPSDVALDRKGYVYLVDAGRKRVMRYDPSGEFVQRVDVDPGIDSTALVQPVAVAADDSLVYVADRGAGQVLRFKRRK
jgi:sugar lactone lactonase YvrE